MNKIEFRWTRKGIEMNGEGFAATMGILIIIVLGIVALACLAANGFLDNFLR